MKKLQCVVCSLCLEAEKYFSLLVFIGNYLVLAEFKKIDVMDT